MINKNKILTVSYGTFSCTLEGFDDSFDTMKAIAEYFRDLASDDRYFGAEPPQPDAEMLARIAERDVSRRVEAREKDGHFMLKAHQEPEASPVATVATSPEDTFSPKTADPQGFAQPSAGSETGEAAVSVDYAALTQEPASHEAPLDADAPGVEHSADTFFAGSPVEQEAEDEEPLTPITPEYHAQEVPEAAPTGGDLSDRLARIRAVVSKQTETGIAQNGYEDDIADDTPPSENFESMSFFNSKALNEGIDEAGQVSGQASETDPAQSGDEVRMVAEIAHDIEEALAEDDQLADEAIEAFESEEDELHNILDQLDADTENAPTKEELLAHAPSMEELAPLSDDDNVEADENVFSTDAIAGKSVENPPETEPNSVTRAQDQEAADLKAAEDTEGKVAARVLKLDSKTLEAAMEKGVLDDVSDLTDADTDPKPAGRDSLPNIGSETDADVTRLMAEADHQMDEPEAATRRNAFEHLRAAVAARFADKTMDITGDFEETTQAFRSDLAEAVKPHRTMSEGLLTERPEATGTAPLKLVAELRVESGDTSEEGMTAPRRATASDHEDVDPGAYSSFANFAEEMGAVKLPELLEAAAAYIAFVEGIEHFSRPQLMTRVRQAEGGNCSREDGLRSFGQLLRSGKIEKVSGGRFAASEEIGFKPNERAAG